MRYLWRQLISWPVLSTMLGLVLLVAVALKGYELATGELLEDSLLSSRWFLILVVEWEAFFVLWLLGGFYRLYPQMTRWVALLYFFALFDVAMDSVLKGKPSCPCFGKAIVPPWIPAVFDLTALLLLAVAPVPQASRQPLQWFRWFVLTAVFSVFGTASWITMRDYSTMTAAPIPLLRKDPRLFVGVLTIQRVRPTTEELLALLRNTTGLNLTADERLQKRYPDYGVWDLKAIQPWLVMEILVHRQKLPARWERVNDGYMMVPAARFGKSLFFWIVCATLLLLSMMGLRRLDIAKGQEKTPRDDADSERAIVVELPVAKC